MNALMIALVVALLATPGGRWWQWARRNPNDSLRNPLSATAACVLAALSGAAVGSGLRGPGLNLLLAIALVAAGLGMMWPARSPAPASKMAPPLATPRLMLAAFSDAAPFVVFAVAAMTRAPVFAMIGGTLGMAGAALLPDMPAMRWARPLIGGALVLAGALTGVMARGLI